MCPVGHYCVAGVSAPSACPPGKYRDTTGATAVGDCVTTPAGYYTSAEGSSSYAANLCAKGHYCLAGSTSATAAVCPAGSYQDVEGQSVATCIACPVGRYCPAASEEPTICPQGYYCEVSSSIPTACPKGTYGDGIMLEQESDCTDCDMSMFCSQSGLGSPDGLCDPGYFCTSKATVPNPTDGTTGDVCPAGGFCEMGSKVSGSCPPGSYNPNTAGKSQQSCTVCDPGKYCSGSNSVTPTGDCDAGYYCPTGSYVAKQEEV